jgi:hypothetical protein
MREIISSHARWLQTGDEVVVLNVGNGRCYHLTKYAATVWMTVATSNGGSNLEVSNPGHDGGMNEEKIRYTKTIEQLTKLGLLTSVTN